jgi:hypothetical protein
METQIEPNPNFCPTCTGDGNTGFTIGIGYDAMMPRAVLDIIVSDIAEAVLLNPSFNVAITGQGLGKLLVSNYKAE